MSLEIRLRNLQTNFVYAEFLKLLDEINAHPNISLESQKIIYQILSMVNDRYIVNGELGTLGHMLLENKLLNKEKISPILLFYFFEEQLEKIGLPKVYVTFYGGDYDMAVSVDATDNSLAIDITLNRFNKYEDVDLYNYTLMQDALHEIAHCYQRYCFEHPKDSYEALIGNNYLNDQEFIKKFNKNSSEGNIMIHESLVTELDADNNAMLYMIWIAQENPQYFNSFLCAKKMQIYQERLHFFETVETPYGVFENLLKNCSSLFKSYGMVTSEVEKSMEQIRFRNQQSQIQDREVNSLYYNIFLKSYYEFQDQKLKIKSDLVKK